MDLRATTLPTPVGPLALLARDEVLVAAGFAPVDALAARLPDAPATRPLRDLGGLSAALQAYLGGDLAALDGLPVEQPGGAFRQAAWAAMRAVPAGRTASYAEIATAAGSPRAVRAAGSACAANLVAPVVPCHRVVRGDGSLGGYGYGLTTKRWLLGHERAALAVTSPPGR